MIKLRLVEKCNPNGYTEYYYIQRLTFTGWWYLKKDIGGDYGWMHNLYRSDYKKTLIKDVMENYFKLDKDTPFKEFPSIKITEAIKEN